MLFQKWQKINFCTRKKFKTTKNAIFGLFSGAKIDNFFSIFEIAKDVFLYFLNCTFFPILEHCVFVYNLGCLSYLGIGRWYFIHQTSGNSIESPEINSTSRRYYGRPFKTRRIVVHFGNFSVRDFTEFFSQ